MAKHTLGRWILGIGGAIGIGKELLTEPPEKEIPAVISTEETSKVQSPQDHAPLSDESENPPRTNEPLPLPRTIERTKQMIEELPSPLPSLKNIPETTQKNPPEFNLNPFFNLEHAKGFVVRVVDGLTKKCVDKITHLMPDLLPPGTIGITVKDVSTPDEQIFQIRLDQIILSDEQEKRWQEFHDIYFKPESESAELVADPSLQDVVPNVTIHGDTEQIETAMHQFEESIALAHVYLQAGMDRQEAKQLVANQAQKAKSSPKGKNKK